MKKLLLLTFTIAIAVGCSSKSAPQPLRAPGGTRPPITNPYASTAAWFIDPANTTTCASDFNNGTSSTCGAAGSGIGPLLTWKELYVGRWNCYGNPWGCPIFPQSTTITFMSGQSVYNDPISFWPSILPQNSSLSTAANGVTILLTGTPVVGANTTLTVTQAHSRSANHPLHGTGVPALAQGKLYLNAARGPNSLAWFTGWTVGTISLRNAISEGALLPTAISTDGTPMGDPTTVDQAGTPWLTGDTLSPETMPNVNIISAGVINNGGLSQKGVLIIEHVTVPENTANGTPPGVDHTTIGPSTQLIESWFQRAVWLKNDGINGLFGDSAIINCALDGGFVGGSVMLTNANTASTPGTMFQTQLTAGYVVAGGGVLGGGGTISFQGVALDSDILLRTQVSAGALSTISFNGYNWIGVVDSESPMTVMSGVLDVASRSNFGQFVLYGAGSLDSGRGQFIYAAGAGAGAATFPIAGGLKINGLTVACVGNQSAVVTALTCNVASATGANFDTSLGATIIGCLFAPGGGAGCNTGL